MRMQIRLGVVPINKRHFWAINAERKTKSAKLLRLPWVSIGFSAFGLLGGRRLPFGGLYATSTRNFHNLETNHRF